MRCMLTPEHMHMPHPSAPTRSPSKSTAAAAVQRRGWAAHRGRHLIAHSCNLLMAEADLSEGQIVHVVQQALLGRLVQRMHPCALVEHRTGQGRMLQRKAVGDFHGSDNILRVRSGNHWHRLRLPVQKEARITEAGCGARLARTTPVSHGDGLWGRLLET